LPDLAASATLDVMRSRVLAVALVCALAAGLAATPRTAYALDPVVKKGTCDLSGVWRLAVEQYDADHLRVRFVVRNVAAASEWQFFGTDDGLRIFALKKIANDAGVARVIRIVTDQAGADVIQASAINYATGNQCGGGLSF
jgi:hypothetical protein